MASTPAPAPTATTEQRSASVISTGARGEGPPSSAGVAGAENDSECSAAWSSRSVTWMRWGRPTAIPASMAAPMSSVWIWQLKMPSPPTTTMESPTSVHACLKPSTEESGASSRNITS